MRSPRRILPLLAAFVSLMIGASAHPLGDIEWRPCDS